MLYDARGRRAGGEPTRSRSARPTSCARATTSPSWRSAGWCTRALEAADELADDGHRVRGHRPAHHLAARRGHDPRERREHRPAGRGRRGQPALLASPPTSSAHRSRRRRSIAAGAPIQMVTAPHTPVPFTARWRTCTSRTPPRSPARSRRPPTGSGDPSMTDDRIQKVTMPKWGLSMKTGKIVEWLVAEGDTITKRRRPGRHRDRQDRRHAGVAGRRGCCAGSSPSPGPTCRSAACSGCSPRPRCPTPRSTRWSRRRRRPSSRASWRTATSRPRSWSRWAGARSPT